MIIEKNIIIEKGRELLLGQKFFIIFIIKM